jgi:predicted kinase
VPVDAASDEYAVRMRRFAEVGRLDHVCERGELTTAQLSELARVIVTFHQNAAVAAADSRFGTPEQVLAPALENFDELGSLLPDESRRLDKLRTWTSDELTRRRARILARKLAWRVRECHGDLHLGNLVLIDKQVTPFYCIEFNDDLRWIDVISEVSFLYVDLLDHQRPDLAGWLLNEWLAISGDFDGVPLLRFYAVYRALVRAKVAGIRGDVIEAGKYLAMAEQLIAPPTPTLTITFGLSGSGKTWASTAMILADKTATSLRLRSDIERKRLFGLSADAASQSGVNSGIYDDETNARTYEHLAKIAAELLENAWSVIIDAAFLERKRRDLFHALADRYQVPFKIRACSASTAAMKQCIAQRHDDASEARLDVLVQQLSHVEPLGKDELPFVLSRDQA